MRNVHLLPISVKGTLTMDIYKNSLKYAKENGEIEQYRESMNLNEECGFFIRRSINENFRNNYLVGTLLYHR